jgi:hypothetical protein
MGRVREPQDLEISMTKDDRLRHGPFAGLTQGAADLLAAAQRYGADWAGGLGKQVLEAGRQAQQANAVGQRLAGQSAMAANAVDPRQNPALQQIARKATAAPYTAAGAAIAAPMVLNALVHGRAPGFRFRGNALQITNVPTYENRAFTSGNVQIYPPGRGPDVVEPSYSGATMRIGDHEGGHSDQYEEDILFFPKWVSRGGGVKNNPLELDADRRGLERTRRRTKR